MSSGKGRSGGGATAANKSVVELVKEATGASEEEINITLQECGYDVNAATNKLIDGGTFSSVINKRQKKKQREEERKNSLQQLQKEAATSAPKVLEVRRQASAGGPRERRERGGSRGVRGARGGGSGGGQPPRPPLDAAADAEQEAIAVVPPAQDAPALADPLPPTYSRAPGPAPAAEALPPVPIKPSEGGSSMSMAERLFKQQQRPPVAPPAAAPAPQQPPQQRAPQSPQAAAAGAAHGQAQPQQLPASKAELGASDPVLDKGAAVAAQAHALAASEPQQQQQAPQPHVNGLQTEHVPPLLAQQAPQQAQQHVSQHDTIATGPQGLGGQPVQPPPRQQQQTVADTTTVPPASAAWGAPQKPATQAAPGPSLGASLMASLGGGASSGPPQPSPPLSDPAIVSHSLGSGGSLGGLSSGQQEAHKPPVILPPSVQQTESGVARVRLQFGQFGVGGDYGSGFTSTVSMPQHQEPTFQQQATNFAVSSYGSQPSGQTGQQPQQQQQQQQPQQQHEQQSSSLQGGLDHFKSGELQMTGQQQVSQQGQQQGQQQQQQRLDAGASFSQQRPPATEQVVAHHAAPPRAAAQQYGYDLSGYGQQYGQQQFGGAFAQQGQHDAFGGSALGGDGSDKRASFDTAYGFQSNLAQPQAAKPADLQNAASGYGQAADGGPGASAAGNQGQAPQVPHQGWLPPGMGSYGYVQAPQNYYAQNYAQQYQGYMHPAASAYTGYAPQQQPQQGGYAPGRPSKQQQQQPQQQQQYGGYGSQGGAGGYAGLKDAVGSRAPVAPDANPYAGASAAFQMQGQYSGQYGMPQQGRQQQGGYSGFGGYNTGGYGSYAGQMQQGQAPNGDAFKMQ